MKKSTLYALWACLFIICAALGFIPEPEGAVKILMRLLALAFFVPPAVLLYQARKEQDTYLLRLIRNLSALSLGATMVLLVANVLSALGSIALGNVLHCILVIVSSPMVCGGSWALSLFLWACLLMTSLRMTKK